MAMLFKPPILVVRKKGDPEQLSKDWEDYLDNFRDFLEATTAAGAHNRPEVAGTPCGECVRSKHLLKLVGGPEVKTLYTHVGKVIVTDSWDETVGKISRGIKGQTNQAAARFKLMQRLPQNDDSFTEWYPNIRDQARCCIWDGYDADAAARDAILLQTRDKQLQQKILSEDTIKFGLSLEQGKKKVDKIISSRGKPEDTRVAQLEEEVRKLKQVEVKKTGGAAKSTCSTCTRPTHGKGVCLGKKVECYSCGLAGHFKGSTVCKGKPEEKKKKKEKANQVDDSEDSEGIGRISKEYVRATGTTPKSKTTDLQLTALDQGSPPKQIKVEFLIDTGVYRTLLTEEHWKQL